MRKAVCIQELNGNPPGLNLDIHGRLCLCKIYEFRKLREKAGYSVYDEVALHTESVTTGIPMTFEMFDQYLVEVHL